MLDVFLPTKKELIPATDFKQVLKKLHNHLYGGGPIKTETKLADEVAKLVLLKIADEISLRDTYYFYAPSEEMKNEYGRNEIYKRVLKIKKDLNGSSNMGFDLGSYWVAEVVHALQKYSLIDSKSYVSPLADVYEIFNSGQFKGGRGQFFTPPVIVNLAFEILQPSSNDLIIDPACGSGNFLGKVISRYCVPTSPYYITDDNKRHDFVSKNVFGRDIETSLLTIANEYLSLVSGVDLSENIKNGDSLNLSLPHYKDLPVGKLTKVFTNPPFGNNIEITNPEILSQYDLGYYLENGKATRQLRKGQHPDRLFLELCVKLLADGGEAAIVLPRQILSGEEKNAVELRKWLLNKVTIEAVIDLPQNTFQPHTGTITSLVVFKKGLSDKKQRKIYFAVCENVGHDRRGLPDYMINEEGNQVTSENHRPILNDDTPLIAEKWLQYKKNGYLESPNWHGFLVDLNEVSSNPNKLLNAWAYNPDASDAYKKVMSLANDKNYEIVQLKELCIDIFVPGRHKRKYVDNTESSVPFLSTTQIFHIHDIDYKYQPVSFAEKQGLLIEEGWILVTRSGSTGRVRYANKEISNYAISDHCIRIVPAPTKIDNGYLYAFLSSKLGQLLIDQGRYASVIETISHTRLGEIPIPVPSLEKQKQIGDLVRQSEKARELANEKRDLAIAKIENILVT